VKPNAIRATRRRLFLLWPVFLLAGCDGLSLPGVDASLEADVRTLLAQHGVQPSRLACRQSGRTRAGTCTVSLSPDQAGRLRATLGLEDASDSAGQRLLRFLGSASETGCQSSAEVPAARWRVWYAAGRPEQLRVVGGSAFEYLVLFYVLEEGQGCIELAYAYG
jgi:hypothetical protein